VLNTMHGGAMQAERSMNVDANWIQWLFMKIIHYIMLEY
jgi:hypothetical protein